MVFCLIWVLAGLGAFVTLQHDNPKSAFNDALCVAFLIAFVALGVLIRFLNPNFSGVL